MSESSTENEHGEELKRWSRNDDLNGVVSELRDGDEVLVQDRSLPLEVFDKDTEKIGSDPHPTEVAYLEGRAGRVFRLRGEYAPDENLNPSYSTPPSLELKQKGKWTTKRSTVTKLAVKNWSERITAEITAGEFVGPEISETTWAEDYTPPNRTPDGDTLGECPDCGSEVVEQDRKATCTGCPLWCPIDEWRAYHA